MGAFTKYVTPLQSGAKIFDALRCPDCRGRGPCLTKRHILSQRGRGVSEALSREGTTSIPQQ